MNTHYYTSGYFSSGLFDQNYAPLADAIISSYGPARVLDVGCGPGALSRAFAQQGIDVTAIDGFATPGFTEPNIRFFPCDLNREQALHEVGNIIGASFDVAVCLEVAEHLEPSSSDHLIRFLCSRAPVVIFSASVPGQGGAGHINCQSRTSWHDRFSDAGFTLAHQVRPRIIGNTDVAVWYRFNLLDYRKTVSSLPPLSLRDLVGCESEIASAYYSATQEITRLRNLLKLPSVRYTLELRAKLKRWLHKT